MTARLLPLLAVALLDPMPAPAQQCLGRPGEDVLDGSMGLAAGLAF